MTVLKQLYIAVNRAISFMFDSDDDLLNTNAKDIITSPEDRIQYLEAVDRLRKKRIGGQNNPEEKITLSSNETITIVSY